MHKAVACLSFQVLANQVGLPSESGEHTGGGRGRKPITQFSPRVPIGGYSVAMHELPKSVLLLVLVLPSLSSPSFLHSLLTSKNRLIQQLTRLFPSQLRRARSYSSSVGDQLAPPPPPGGGFVTLHQPAPDPSFTSRPSQMYNRPPWAAPTLPSQCPPCPPCAQCQYMYAGSDNGLSDTYGPPQDHYGSYGPPQDTYAEDNYSPPQESYGPPQDQSYKFPQNMHYNSFGRPSDENVYKPHSVQPASDSYGAPLGPPLTTRPCQRSQGWSGAPSGPCSKPIYDPQPYPSPPPYTTSNPVSTSYQPPFHTTTTTPAPACLEVFTSNQFSLTSARGIRPPSSCTYVIVPSEDICSLSLSIIWFNLRDSPYCAEESLSLESQKLCGNHTGDESEPIKSHYINKKYPFLFIFSVRIGLPANGNAWELIFLPSSGHNPGYRGFRIHGVQNRCREPAPSPPAPPPTSPRPPTPSPDLAECEFTCSGATLCLVSSQVCDGLLDCPQGDDEEDCDDAVVVENCQLTGMCR